MAGLGTGGLFGKKKKDEVDLTVEPPARMADPFDPAIRERERALRERQRQRGGRAATILSEELRDRVGVSGSVGT